MNLVEGTARITDTEQFLSKLEDVSDSTECTVQAFDARYVVDRSHLERAVALADRAFAREEAVARDRGVEVLLYAAGRRQIDEAFEMGIKVGETPVVILVDHPDEDETAESSARKSIYALDSLDAHETVGEFDQERVKEFFNVTDVELAATDGGLEDVIHERVALLDVEK